MKRKLLNPVILFALLLLIAQCKKADSKTASVTCSLLCSECTVRNSNYGGQLVYTDSLCGSSTSIAIWEAGIAATYPAPYDVSFTSATGQTKQICGADTNTAIATYTTAGYTCN